MNRENRFMRMAWELALKGKGKTSPNPMVGAVVVKNGRVIGRGYHKKAGGPHAEVFALNEAKGRARGGTLYVTLEPCSVFGRTPPCVEKIISHGIRQVIIGAKDPNPLNNGRGIRALRSFGIKVKVGVLKDALTGINEVFIKYSTKRLPFVTLKIAQSLDGKIATKTGDSRWISGGSARRYVHRLRRETDAVLIGVNTIIKDNPLLTSRLSYCKSASSQNQPLKIVVDTKLKTPLRARIFSRESPAKVIIATAKSAPERKIKALSKYAKLITFDTKNGGVNLKSLMKTLAGMEISSVLVEGGGKIAASLLKERLVDKVLFFVAPKIIGGKEALTSVEGEGIPRVSRAIKLKDIEITRFGEDILLQAYPVY